MAAVRGLERAELSLQFVQLGAGLAAIIMHSQPRVTLIDACSPCSPLCTHPRVHGRICFAHAQTQPLLPVDQQPPRRRQRRVYTRRICDYEHEHGAFDAPCARAALLRPPKYKRGGVLPRKII